MVFIYIQQFERSTMKRDHRISLATLAERVRKILPNFNEEEVY